MLKSGSLIVAVMQPAQSGKRENTTRDYGMEAGCQVFPFRVQDGCGPHDSNEHIRRGVASDAVR